MSKLSKKLKDLEEQKRVASEGRLLQQSTNANAANKLFAAVVAELETLASKFNAITVKRPEGVSDRVSCEFSGRALFNVHANNQGGVTFSHRQLSRGGAGRMVSKSCNTFESAEKIIETYISPKL